MVHDRFDGCGLLRQGEGFQLAGEREDLPGLGRGTDSFELGVHADYWSFAHVFASDGALMRGRRFVVSLGHFRAVSLLEHQFLLREEVVGEHPVKLPDLVQECELGRGVVAVVVNKFTHVGPVLLLDVGAVVAVAGTGPGEGDLVVHAVFEQVVVDELAPVVRIDPDDWEREHPADVHERFEHPLLGLVLH